MRPVGSAESFGHKAWTGLAVGAAAAILLGLLTYAGTFENIELKLFDVWHEWLTDPAMADDDILLVTIDQGSIEMVKKTLGYSPPWPRILYGRMLRYIRSGRPRGVVFDLMLEGQDEDRDEITGSESDALFAEAIAQSGLVVLGFKMRPPDPNPPSAEAERLLGRVDLKREPWPTLTRFNRVDPLASQVIESGARFGFVNVDPEDDGVIRRVNLLANVRGRLVPSMMLAARLAHLPASEVELEPGLLRLASADLPVCPDGRAWIRFRGPGGAQRGRGRTYTYLPAYNVFQSAVGAEQGGEIVVPRETFRDKWVVIGSTASAGFDLKATPFSKEGTFPGMEIQATVLDNLLHGDFLWRLPAWLVLIEVLAACLLVGFLGRVMKNILWGGLLLLVGMGGYAAVSVGAFTRGVMVDLVAVEVAIFVTFAGVTFFNFLRERRGKQYIRSIFQYYLDPSVVDSLLETPEQLRLGGESRVCTAFFSDIAGFTSISEQLTPERLVETMNLYLGEMTEIVIRHGGFLDKYIGDAIMAVFGAPAELPRHAEAACLAALESHRRLEALNLVLQERGIPPLACRVGINTGEMVVGNMGSETRMNYTAMGDSVNLASRLEGVNKEFGTATIIGQDTRGALDDRMATRELDFMRVKGKQEPVRIYELVGATGGLDDRTLEALGTFGDGLRAYRARDWDLASRCFAEVLGLLPDDGPARTYRERCRVFQAEPPPEGWDGVFVMTHK